MNSLTVKQKIFLIVYPFINVALTMLLMFSCFSLCLDPGEDLACEERGTWVGFLRNSGMIIAGILMAPAMAVERVLRIFSFKNNTVLDYFLIFLSGLFYAIIFLLIYKFLMENKNQKKL